MLRQKAFIKVTGRGNVSKVVREHYLREDIPCGIFGCTECALLLEGSEIPALLDPRQQVKYTLAVGRPHILLPDTNILLHHLDVLEMSPFRDVIILQTVLDEVKGNSAAIYRRVRSLITQPEKRFFVFSNENHRQTFIEKTEGETANDRNDRSIRKATAWYASHLSTQAGPLKEYGVILLTNDVDNGRRAEAEGLTAMRLKEYCGGLVGVEDSAATILDMLETVGPEDGFDSGIEYTEYLSMGLLQAGVKGGNLLQGTMQVSPYSSHTGTITVDGTTVRIVGRANINRAMQGDVVVVELLKEAEAMNQAEKTEELAEERQKEVELIALPAEETLPDEPTPVNKEAFGKVIGIIRRSARSYCGSIDRKTISGDGSGKQNVLIVPLDRRIPRIRIRTSNAAGLATQRLLISVDGWERRSRYPHGHLVRMLGAAGERGTETEVILLEHDVAYADFTPQVLACLPSTDWKPQEEDYTQREDLRHLNVCSVDPPGCTDIDDALHAIHLPNGNIEVGVHIADVTHFVKADTPLDREATQRSTTVYLVDRRIDMLPSLLGTNLCSLKSNVERFAFSCVWELTPDARILSTRFFKSIIASKASFTYDEAQARLENPNDDDPLGTSLKILNGLAKQLKARRIEAGALTLASPEVRFTLETETMNPVDVVLKEMKDANSMVEEFMLLANISVAERIYTAFSDTAILRRHPSPPAENFAALNKALAQQGVPPLHVETSKGLAESLDLINVPGDPFFNRLVRIMTTRCMYQAQYFAAGTVSHEAFWHYGLAAPIYTHFTSPIRRYADVLVHRLLYCAITADSKGIGDKQKLEEITTNMNYRHRMAQQAQRSSIELYTHLFFRGKTTTEDAYIIKLMQNGLVALIPKYGIEGVIHWEDSELEAAGVTSDAETGRFIKDGRPFLGLFQKISISISVEEIESSQRQKLVVKLADPIISSTLKSASPAAGQKRPMEQ